MIALVLNYYCRQLVTRLLSTNKGSALYLSRSFLQPVSSCPVVQLRFQIISIAKLHGEKTFLSQRLQRETITRTEINDSNSRRILFARAMQSMSMKDRSMKMHASDLSIKRSPMV